MRTVELGRTGLRVSEVAFGGIPIQRLTHDEAAAVVRGCLDLGVTFLDTAHGYTTSEERIGAAIAGRREGLVLASKTPAQTGEQAREQLALSLKRLGVDYIDIYQLHGVSDEEQLAKRTAPGGPLDVLRQAKEKGLIRHIGITSHQVDVAVKAVRTGLFETMMFPLNFVAREPGLEVLKACQEEGVGFIAMKPMGGGMLENAAVAFQFLRQYPAAVPVVGIERVAEMAEIVSLYEQPAELTAAQQADMERIREELGPSFCRRCEYCQPCPAGISISTVMNVPASLKRMPPERVYGEGWVRAAVEAVADCQDCGDCESRCPYNLPIRTRMAEVVEIFERGAAAWRASL